MKRIVILFVIAVFTLTACHDESRIIRTEDGSRVLAEKFEFEGHHYIMFRSSSVGTYDHITGFVHDPNCPCFNHELSGNADLPAGLNGIKNYYDAYNNQVVAFLEAERRAREAAEAQTAAYKQYYDMMNPK